MSCNVVLSSSREIPLLLFLWKWKVSTTAALIKRFFPTCNGKTAYNRLLALRKAGMIQVRSDDGGQKFICALNQGGYDRIKNKIANIESDGFRSEHMGHDLLVGAFQLGNWLTITPPEVDFFTEQQLRRIAPKFYPPWVPNSSTHRPDGYTRITAGGQQTTIAIEVELSHKTDADYLRIAEHYELFRTIAKVLWLVPRKSTAYTLHEKMKNATKQRANPHNFVQFQDFQERGWNCKVLVGPDTGKTLSEFYSEIRQNSGERPPDASLAHLLLDLRKSPHVAMTYRGYELGDFPT